MELMELQCIVEFRAWELVSMKDDLHHCFGNVKQIVESIYF